MTLVTENCKDDLVGMLSKGQPLKSNGGCKIVRLLNTRNNYLTCSYVVSSDLFLLQLLHSRTRQNDEFYRCSGLLESSYKCCVSFKEVPAKKAPEAIKANMPLMSGQTGCDHHLSRVSKSRGRQRSEQKQGDINMDTMWSELYIRNEGF